VLQVQGLSIRGGKGKPVLDNVSFAVRAGEIVGVAGISGNGQSELIHSIAGLHEIDRGNIVLLGQEIAGRSVRSIRERGLAYIPEDRYMWGAAKEATVLDNGLMGHQWRMARGGWLRGAAIRRFVAGWVQRYAIKSGGLAAKARHMSGGNLQKLIVARELAQETPFLIAAEPTRGVDIGAMETIHGHLLEKRSAGGAILLVSSELTEILKLSDRILVMYEGAIAGELSAADATEEKISLLMAGGKASD
jgi:simple sugar transport system ATP-binding protein